MAAVIVTFLLAVATGFLAFREVVPILTRVFQLLFALSALAYLFALTALSFRGRKHD